MEDIKFLRDQYEYERIQNLREILHILDEPQVTPEVNFARRFLFSVIRTGAEHTQKQQVIIKHTPHHQKQYFRPAATITIPASQSNQLQPSLLDTQTTPKIIVAPTALQDVPAPKVEPVKPIFVEEVKKPEAPTSPDTIGQHPLIRAGNRIVAYATINYQPHTNNMTYTLSEPVVDQTILAELVRTLQEKSKTPDILRDDAKVKTIMEKIFAKHKTPFSLEAYENMKYHLWRDYLFLGKIDALTKDKHITLITCPGLNRPITVHFQGVPMLTNITYTNQEDLNRTVRHLGLLGGKEVSKQNPILDILASGMRIEATYGEDTISSRFILRKVQP